MKVLKVIFAAGSLISIVNCTKKNPAAAVDPIKRIQEAIAKNPSYENYISLGLELAKKGQSNEGIAAYQKAIKINPNAPLAYNNICAELNRQKKYAEALSPCEKAVAQDPGFVLAKNNLEFAKQKLVETRDSIVQKERAAGGR